MTIWYDYTTTIRNTGRNGIANVEWSVGRALSEARGDVRACALGSRGGLVAIDAERALAGAVYAQSERSAPDVGTVTTTGRTGVRSAVVELLETHAPWVIPPILGALRLQVRARSLVRSRLPRRPADGPALRPLVGRDDVVVSMGADWSGTLADELARLRADTGCRVITMVYDLIPLTHPHLAFHNDPEFFAEYYARLLRCSDVITCISNQSRCDLLDFATARPISTPPVEVLRLGEDEPRVGPAEERREDFFLWVGTVERRKNLELLYDALRIVESDGDAVPTIVVAGSLGWGVNDLVAELSHGTTVASRSIVLLGGVDDDTLDHLYRRARALVFPSQFEGWGLPVREAAIRGCPVLAGDSPAVREATAGLSGVIMLPVDDPGPWADALRRPPPAQQPAPRFPWSSTAAALGVLADGLTSSDEDPRDRR